MYNWLTWWEFGYSSCKQCTILCRLISAISGLRVGRCKLLTRQPDDLQCSMSAGWSRRHDDRKICNVFCQRGEVAYTTTRRLARSSCLRVGREMSQTRRNEDLRCFESAGKISCNEDLQCFISSCQQLCTSDTKILSIFVSSCWWLHPANTKQMQIFVLLCYWFQPVEVKKWQKSTTIQYSYNL